MNKIKVDSVPKSVSENRVRQAIRQAFKLRDAGYADDTVEDVLAKEIADVVRDAVLITAKVVGEDKKKELRHG